MGSITDARANYILDGIEDLGCVAGVNSIEGLEGMVSSTTPQFRSLVAELAAEIGRVYGFENTVDFVEGEEPDAAAFQIELSGFLDEAECPYLVLRSPDSLSTIEHRVLLIEFLLSETAAARMNNVIGSSRFVVRSALTCVFIHCATTHLCMHCRPRCMQYSLLCSILMQFFPFQIAMVSTADKPRQWKPTHGLQSSWRLYRRRSSSRLATLHSSLAQ
eukprot:m.191289 g.191289  ORF g.191289 m.191289 type:complete len:218 (-) comp15145_c0_seq5:828-1481(-)